MGTSFSHGTHAAFAPDPAKVREALNLLRSSAFYSKLSDIAIEGVVLTPETEADYNEARNRVFNVDMRGYPLVIAQVKSVSDIAKCVNFVREYGNGIKLGVSCGGHSNKCMVDGSFVVDMRNMKSVTMDITDPDNMTATVEGGAFLEEVDKALGPHNLGMVAGTYPLTGIGGWTLAGGFGWLGRMYGMGVDNLVEIEVVLASGEVVVANDRNEHANLIVGCRGGGGNYGIVSKFTFKIHKMPTYCHAGTKVYLTPTLSSAIGVCSKADALFDEAPDNCSMILVLPAGAPVIPSVWVYFDEQSSTKSIPILAKASKVGGWFNVADSVKTISYHNELQRMTADKITSGLLFSTLVQAGTIGQPMPASFFEELLAHVKKAKARTLEGAAIILFPMGGKLQTGAGLDTVVSVGSRNAKYFGIIDARWKPSAGEAGREDARAWVSETARIMSKYSTSRMRHATDSISESAAAAGEAVSYDAGYDEAGLQRLRDIKQQYDPSNFFSLC